MAENKKSFILYADQHGLFEKLPDEIAGKLIKHIFRYVNDENPESDDLLIQIAFEPIRLQLKRDLKSWEEIKKDKSVSGRIGNLKRWNPDIYKDLLSKKITLEEAENIAKHRTRSQPIANIAVNDTVTVNVNDNVTKEKKEVKEKKAEINSAPPSFEIFIKYAFEKGNELQLEVCEKKIQAKYLAWHENNWRTGKGQVIKNWKTTLLNTLNYLQKEKSSAKKENEKSALEQHMERLHRDKDETIKVIPFG
jgi:hypothetical protein